MQVKYVILASWAVGFVNVVGVGNLRTPTESCAQRVPGLGKARHRLSETESARRCGVPDTIEVYTSKVVYLLILVVVVVVLLLVKLTVGLRLSTLQYM